MPRDEPDRELPAVLFPLREPELPREDEARDPLLRVPLALREFEPVLRELALLLRDVARELEVRARVPLELVLGRRFRVAVARWSRGISARTSSLTKRVSSASRNLAMRSSSRRTALASCAVSRSPTASASVRIRE